VSRSVAAAAPILAGPAKQEVRVPFGVQLSLRLSHITMQRASGDSASEIWKNPVDVRSLDA
jgi:hypothetical protein